MATMKTLNGYGFNATELGGKAPEYYIQPRNLLDNSDFTNPVNQRGQTSYSGGGYTIDRWNLTNSYSSITVNDGYVTFNASGGYCYPQQFVQASASMIGKTYTAAVCLNDGTIYVFGNGILTTLSPSSNTLIGNRPDIGNGIQLGLYIRTDGMLMIQLHIPDGQSLSLRWAALYEGSYTADTLPPYVPKGYAAELAECQRYYVPVLNNILAGYTFGSLTTAQVFIPLSVPLRTAGTTVLPTINVVNYGSLRGNGYTVVPTAIRTFQSGVTDNGIVLELTIDETNIGGAQCVVYAGMEINISADL